MSREGRRPSGARLARAVVLTLAVIAAASLATPAGALANWGRPFQFAPPGSLDYLPTQLAFSGAGASAAAFGIEDVDVPGSSRAYLTTRSARGAVGGPRQIGGAPQIIALAYDGPALELLIGAGPKTLTCCSSVQAIRLSARGRLGAARTLVAGLTGATDGRLLTLAGGQMLAAVATERGVWVAQSGRGHHFGAQHLLTARNQLPQAMDAAWLGGDTTIVAWTAGRAPAGATDPRTIYTAGGSRAGPPRRVQTAVIVASGHRIDELAVARRSAGATLAWVESWYGAGGNYHSLVRTADLGPRPQAQTISPANRIAAGLTLHADAAGDQGLAWQSCTSAADCATQTAVRAAKAGFGPAATLGSIDASQSPALAVGPRGQVLVGWIRGGQAIASVGSARNRRFGSPTVLSPSIFAVHLTVAFGPRRQALAAWTQGTLNPSVVGVAYRAH